MSKKKKKKIYFIDQSYAFYDQSYFFFCGGKTYIAMQYNNDW